MKESHVLYPNRPFSICLASDIGLERFGTLLDEDLAIQLHFPIRQLQYVRVSLESCNHNSKNTRITGVVRCTIQILAKGRPDRSVALNARVVRNLHKLTGAEALADLDLMKKLRLSSSTKGRLVEERENGYTSDANAGAASRRPEAYPAASVSSSSLSDEDEEIPVYSDTELEDMAKRETDLTKCSIHQSHDDSDCDKSSAKDYNCGSSTAESLTDYFSKEADAKSWIESTGRNLDSSFDSNSSLVSMTARVRKVRNKDTKYWTEFRNKINWEKELEKHALKEAERDERTRLYGHDFLLDKYFSGGAEVAHRSLARSLEFMKREKKKKEAFEKKRREKKLKEDLEKKKELRQPY